MKLKIFLASLTCAAFLFFLSCKQEQTQIAPQQITTSKRLDFLRGKSFEVIKNDYRILPEQVQKELWLEKVQQLLTQKLPQPQLLLIKELENELLKTEFSLNSSSIDAKIDDIGLNLAKITPKANFLAMFVTLDDYYFKDKFIDTEICSECIADMESDLKKKGGIENTLKTRRLNCDCKWTCGAGGYTTTSNCNPTSSGCGWLWRSPCGELNCPGNCP